MAPIPASQLPTGLKLSANQNVDLPNETSEPLPHYEISYNGKVLQFTMEAFGSRPTLGYALYIALHGGGGVASEQQDPVEKEKRRRSNNEDWYYMATDLYYFNFKGANPSSPNQGVDGAIYVALRGIQDSWDMHFRPESYVLLEQLIMSLLQPINAPLVDSNRVFLTGFSAGGDGVYRLATKLSDRFAAVNMSAGHPGRKAGDLNRVSFQNLTNLPFCSQVGEKDGTVKDRALDVVWNADKRKLEPAYHNNWERAEDSTSTYQALNQDILPNWFRNNGTSPRNSTATNSNAIKWMTEQGSRNPIPPLVVWNLASRPPPPEILAAGSTLKEKRFFYWLFLRKPIPAGFEPSSAIRTTFEKDQNSFWIEQPNDYIAILLNANMLNLGEHGKFDKPVLISVTIGAKDVKNIPLQIEVTPSEKIRQQTFEASGDKALEFTAAIYFEYNQVSKKWEVKTTDTLDIPGPVKARL